MGGGDVFENRSSWPNFFSRLVARLHWNPAAIDLASDAREWPELPEERRGRLLKLLAGFCVAEEQVAEQLTPFADAAREATLMSQESLMAWVFFLQRRDEQRHAALFDRIAAEVLELPGDDAAERRAAAREHVQPAFLELFEEQLPAMAADLAEGRTGLGQGVSLYHMLLEGVVFDAGQKAVLDELADGALPGVREGIERVKRDERWHVGFGLRCLIETEPTSDQLDDLLQARRRSGHDLGRRRPGRHERAERAEGRPPPQDRSAHRVAGARVAAIRARTRAASRAPERRSSWQAAERTPAMSAPASRTTGRSSRRRAPASATCRPAAWASATSDVERVGRAPLQQPAAVLDGGVEQADPDARSARDARQQLGRERRVGHALRVRVGRRHDHRARHVRSTVPDRAQQSDRVRFGRDAPQTDLDERRAALRRAQGGERRRARQVGHVADRGADRQLGGHGRAHLRDHRRGRRAQRALGGVLDVHDLGPRRGGGARLLGVDDAHEQLHDRSTRAPRLSNPTSSTLPSPPTSSSMRRASSRPAASLPTTP